MQSINPTKPICSKKQKNKSTLVINVEKPLNRDQKTQKTVNTPLIPKQRYNESHKINHKTYKYNSS